jgi:GTPase SAR1 family protein
MCTTTADQLRKAHNNRQDEILALLSDISEWYKNNAETSEKNEDSLKKSEAFKELAEKFKSGEYTIVVIGEYSTGKSTMLNALMGEKLLPSFSTSATATVNFLRHTEQAQNGEKGCVFYSDNSTLPLNEVNVDVIEKYATTRGDDVLEKVSHLDLYYDSDFLRDNVTLVDSPGLNDVNKELGDITMEQIQKSHACIFVFTSHQPGSESTFGSLRKVKDNLNNIIFVLNQIDIIHSYEGDTPESVINTIQTNYSKYFSDDNCPEIWPISAMQALEARSKSSDSRNEKSTLSDDDKDDKGQLLKASRIEAFEARLLSYLTEGEKTKTQSLEPVIRVITVGNHSKSELNDELSLLKNSEDTAEVEKQIAAVNSTIADLQTQIDGCGIDIIGQIKLSFQEIRESIDANLDEYKTKAIDKLLLCSSEGDIKDTIARINKGYEKKVMGLLETADDDLRTSVLNNIVQNNYKAFVQKIQEGLDKVESKVIISVDLNLDGDYVFYAGIEEMERQENELKKQLDLLKAQFDEAEESVAKTRGEAAKQQKLEREIHEIDARIHSINQSMDNIPAPIITPTTFKRRRTKDEMGLLSKIRDVFSPKLIIDQKNVYDYTLRDAAINKQSEALRAAKSEREKLASQMNDSAEVNADLSAKKFSRLHTEYLSANERYNDLLEKNRNDFQEKHRVQIQKMKNEISDNLEDNTKELMRNIRKELKNMEKSFVDIVVAVITNKLSETLKNEEQKKSVLLKTLSGSQQARDERVALLIDRLERLNDILGRAVSLKTELEGLSLTHERQ